MDVFLGIGNAIEQVIRYVETHHWIFGFLAAGLYSIFTTKPFTQGLMHSTNG